MDPLRVYTLSSKHTYGPMRARVVVQLFYNVTSSSILSWQHKYQQSRAHLSMVYRKQTPRCDWQPIRIISLMNN